jgi:DNA-binding Lrp family transcriptional regulator
MELDRADLTLLEMLQRDGRTTIQALSEAIHLSARATLNRVRKLEATGMIEGYRALINRAALGEQISVFAEVALKDQRQAVVQRFEKRMAATPEVIACYVISGRYDYIVRIACPHLADYFPRLIEYAQSTRWGKNPVTREEAAAAHAPA